MINRLKTVILFGRSPFIGTISEQIPEIIKKYPVSVGCNTFYQVYPQVPYSAFVDTQMTENYKDYNGIVLTVKEHTERIRHIKNYRTFFLTSFDDYVYKPERGTTAWKYDTPSLVMSLAIGNKFENLVLIGVDYSPSMRGHFNDKKDMKWTEDKFEKARKWVEETISKHIKVYTCNPNSIIKIPYISIKELLENSEVVPDDTFIPSLY